MSIFLENDSDDASLSEINTTPLVDVMLVLLIIFMVTIPAVTHMVPLQLPEIEQGSNSQPNHAINVYLNERGEISIAKNDKPTAPQPTPQTLSLTELTQHLKGHTRPVALHAHKTLSYEQVLKVLASIQAAGVTQIEMNAKVE